MSLMHKLLADSFGALQNRNFRIFASGQAISLIGTFMQQTAQQWLVWEITHDPRWIGVAGALGFLPMLFLGPFTGSLADRVNRRKLLLVTQSIDLVLALTLCALVAFGSRQLWPILLLALLLGISSAFTFPAQSALIGDLTSRNEIRRAYALVGAMVETGRLVGPAIAGQVVAVFGTAVAFALNGLSFVAVIISLLLLRTHQIPRASSAGALKDFAESLRYIRAQPRLQDLLFCRVAITMFVFSSLQLSAPIADGILHGGPRLLGNMLAVSGAGALLGALLISPQVIKVQRAGLAFCVVLLWSGVWQMLGSFWPSTPIVLLSVFGYSMGIPIVLSGVGALSQLLSPDHMRAQLSGLFQMVSFGTQPLGALVVGWLGSAFGPLMALRINGLAMSVVVLALLVLRNDFRRWEPASGGREE